MAIGDDILRERLNLREQQLMQQADALDVKASILLVAVTFLAGHSMYLLSKQATGFIRWDQFTSVLLQIVAGIILSLQLRIRTYKAEMTHQYPTWRNQIVEHHEGESREQVEHSLNEGIRTMSLERITDAAEINENKARFVNLAYWVILAAFFCNLAAIVPLLFN